jgi:hypothetical protein
MKVGLLLAGDVDGDSRWITTSVRLKVEQWQLVREGILMNAGFFLRKGAP